MNLLLKFIYKSYQILNKGLNKVVLTKGLKACFNECGENVRIAYNCDIKSAENIIIGSNSQIGPHAVLWTTRAKIKIGSYVLIGPNVTIITGDHRTDVIGRHIEEITDEEKLPVNDADVVIEDGVWIGSNVTILKGVTVGEGSILAAGSVVTKNIEPYSVYGGIPAKKIKNRFSENDLEKHLIILKNRI